MPANDVGSWPSRASRSQPESAYAWNRLSAALLLSAIGGIGMWSVIVALPAVQAEFGVARSAASLPYTMTMICFGFGGILMGRLSDRFGIMVPVVGGAVCLGAGYVVASRATSLWQFILVQGLLVGVASSVAFAPLIADTSLWFTRRRGIAVAVIASGSYVAGTAWPPIVQHFIETQGWRRTYLGIGVFCVATMVPLALLALRRRSPLVETGVRDVERHRALAAAARDVAGRAANLAGHRRAELLRRDVHAAGAHRGLLPRSGPRRRTRGPDAVLDAGLRRRQPIGLGLDL